MAYLLERITQQLSEEGLEPRTNAAREWLKAKVKNLSPQRTTLMKDRDKIKNRSMLGCMYFYFYDPKLKDSLPYYDRFPLVIPIERYSDGFLGLNLHYIHPKQRMILLDKFLCATLFFKFGITSPFPTIFKTTSSYRARSSSFLN